MGKRVLYILVCALIFFSMLSIFFIFYAQPQKTLPKSITGAAQNGGLSIIIEGGKCQVINLVQGWNFISIYSKQSNYSISNIFSPITGFYDYLLEWNSSSQEFNAWSSAGAQSFTVLNENKSYFIYMSQAQNLTICGRPYGNKTFNLVYGWESPDYIYEFPSNVTNNTFYGINFSYIQKWNIIAQDFLVYSPSAPTNPFNQISPSEGYFIFTSGGNLIYVRT